MGDSDSGDEAPARRRKLVLPTSYDVGYGKPPAVSRFRPGESGNPGGRPRGARNKLPRLGEERLKEIVIREAYRTIRVREGSRNITVSMAEAVVRALAVSGARGNNRAAHLFTRLLINVEHENKELLFRFYRKALDYKDAWTIELERRKRLNITAPDPVPHPDDIEIDPRTGEVRMHGPLIAEEKQLWVVAEGVKVQIKTSIRSARRKLKRDLDPLERRKIANDLRKNEDFLQELEAFFDPVVAARQEGQENKQS